MTMGERVTPKLVPLIHERSQIVAHEDRSRGRLLTHETKGGEVRSGESEPVQNGSPCQESRPRKVIECEGDQWGGTLDRQRPPEQETGGTSLPGTVHSLPGVAHLQRPRSRRVWKRGAALAASAEPQPRMGGIPDWRCGRGPESFPLS